MNGLIILHNAETFEEVRVLNHGEHVFAFCFNRDGDKIVTCSLTKTMLWSVASGEIIHSVQNPKSSRAMAVSFIEGSDNAILVFFESSSFQSMCFDDAEDSWVPFGNVLRQDSIEYKGGNSPNVVSFSPAQALRKLQLDTEACRCQSGLLMRHGPGWLGDVSVTVTCAKARKGISVVIQMCNAYAGTRLQNISWAFSMMGAFASGIPQKVAYRYRKFWLCAFPAAPTGRSSSLEAETAP